MLYFTKFYQYGHEVDYIHEGAIGPCWGAWCGWGGLKR